MSGSVVVEISVEDPAWTQVDLAHLSRQACEAGAAIAVPGMDIEVSLLATNDAQIAALNGQFRGKEAATNVLSWPTEALANGPGETPRPPSDPEIGDIALSYDICVREAAQQNKSVHDHLSHLVLHGFLHLLGYDHVRDEDATVMEALEIKALETLGIENPYN